MKERKSGRLLLIESKGLDSSDSRVVLCNDLQERHVGEHGVTPEVVVSKNSDGLKILGAFYMTYGDLYDLWHSQIDTLQFIKDNQSLIEENIRQANKAS